MLTSVCVQVELHTATQAGSAYKGPCLQYTLTGLQDQQVGPVDVPNSPGAGFEEGGTVHSTAHGPVIDELIKLQLFLEGGPEVGSLSSLASCCLTASGQTHRVSAACCPLTQAWGEKANCA